MSEVQTLYSYSASNRRSTQTINVKPHGLEKPLRVALVILGLLLWIAIIVSIVGAIYAVFLGVFFFFAHVSLIAHLRGSGVKLSPQQMPELYSRIDALAGRLGFEKTPDAYLMQSGGALNAFATRFFRTDFVVLYTDMVEACGDNPDALDFIIAHELGHLHRGHLKWRWLIMPAYFIPFLGSAYSRACEFTCDRYGYFASSNQEGSLLGLCILAAGPKQAARLNHREFAAQSRDLDTMFMRMGEWLASHPPLSIRLAALNPMLKPEKTSKAAYATFSALVLATILVTVPVVGGTIWIKAIARDFSSKIQHPPSQLHQ